MGRHKKLRQAKSRFQGDHYILRHRSQLIPQPPLPSVPRKFSGTYRIRTKVHRRADPVRVAVVGSVSLEGLHEGILAAWHRGLAELELESPWFVVGFVPAPGVGRVVAQWALQEGLTLHASHAEWTKGTRMAIREANERLVQWAQVLVALWDGSSPGTRWAIEFARALNLPLSIQRCEHLHGLHPYRHGIDPPPGRSGLIIPDMFPPPEENEDEG